MWTDSAPRAKGILCSARMRWQIIDGPYECEAGEDAHMAWEWTIEGGGQRRKVRVELSTDLIDAESAAIESQLAASLRGRSAFETVSQ